MITPDEKASLSEPEVQSPFIEGTNIQYAWDSTSLSVMLECPQRYKLKIIEGWRSTSPNTAIALAFGILVHTGVEEFHRAKANGHGHQDAVEYALQQVMTKRNFDSHVTLYAQLPTHEDIEEQKAEDDEDNGVSLRNSKVRTRYHLWRALVWYFEQYRNDPMPVVTLSDGRPAVEYSFRVGVGRTLSDGTELLLAGHLDKLVNFNGQNFVSDVKTTKSITRQYFAMFDLSHQMTGYTLGGKLAFTHPVAGVVIDALALQVGGVQFARAFTYRTESQLQEYIYLLSYVGEQAERFYEHDYYPLNTAACLFCEFKDVCRQPPQLRHGYLNHLFERKEAWNPLKSR
jgi:hypothetical protein